MALLDLSSSLDGYLSRKVLSRDAADSLVRQLCLLMSIAGDGVGDADTNTFDHLLVRLVESAEADTRGFLAVQLSVSDRPPPATLMRLARDTIEVARPILVHSAHLTDADLVRIALETGLSQMNAIAERAELSIEITDILLMKGDDVVRRAVASNHGARISNDGFRRLAKQAVEDLRLEEALVGREDVPDLVIRFLVRNGAGYAREAFAAMERGFADMVRLPAAKKSPLRSAEAWYGIYDFEAAEVRLAALAEQGLRGETLLLRLIAAESFPEAAVMVSRMSGVRVQDMVGWMTAADPALFLAAARLIPLPPRAVFGLLNIGPWRQQLDGRGRQAAIRQYQSLDHPAAAERVAAWRKRLVEGREATQRRPTASRQA
jgi:hypothetical protein